MSRRIREFHLFLVPSYLFQGILPDESQFLEVPELTDGEAVDILKLWLSDHHRKLNESQENVILKLVSNCRSQLFFKLALEQAVQWKSYTVLEEGSLGPSVRHMIISLFERLDIFLDLGLHLFGCFLALLFHGLFTLQIDLLLLFDLLLSSSRLFLFLFL